MNAVGPGGHDSVLELSGVHAGYGTIEVLHGIDLSVPRGSVVLLLGPNGGGKSTTLKVCCGLIRATKGSISFLGQSTRRIPAQTLARSGLRTVPEGRGIFANLTVRENLWIAAEPGQSREDVERAAFDRFPRLAERRNQLGGTMSGGEQQMLAIARVLATSPQVLLLDELSMGLAPLVVSELYELVADLATSGVSILIAEQFARAVVPIADHAVVLVNGRIVRSGKPAHIEEELASAYLGS